MKDCASQPFTRIRQMVYVRETEERVRLETFAEDYAVANEGPPLTRYVAMRRLPSDDSTGSGDSSIHHDSKARVCEDEMESTTAA